MYKIYINGTPLFLTSTKDFLNLKLEGENFIKMRYIGKKKFLHNYIDLLEKNTSFNAIVLHSSDLEKMWDHFHSIYKIIEASGGVVKNEKEEVLMIYRLGFWDLPKGKIEKGETRKEAAIREVQEETGLQNVDLQDFIHTTYHTYLSKKGKRILKVSYWFTMNTTESDLIPQEEEGIEQAVFTDLTSFFSQPRKIYGNILDVLEKYRTFRS
ncbi:MAG: NUDIX domain-containing protein [Saprospiraceae bacterium]